MGRIVDDVAAAAEWISNALISSGYDADFSVTSLSEIDRFVDEHAPGGQPLPNGLLAENLGTRIFALGAYTGEVIRRSIGGTWPAGDEARSTWPRGRDRSLRSRARFAAESLTVYAASPS